MSDIQVKYDEHGYVMVPKEMLGDPRLSLQAKGLMSFLMAEHAGSSVSAEELGDLLGEEVALIEQLFDELIAAGYVDRLEKGQEEELLDDTQEEEEVMIFASSINSSSVADTVEEPTTVEYLEEEDTPEPNLQESLVSYVDDDATMDHDWLAEEGKKGLEMRMEELREQWRKQPWNRQEIEDEAEKIKHQLDLLEQEGELNLMPDRISVDNVKYYLEDDLQYPFDSKPFLTAWAAWIKYLDEDRGKRLNLNAQQATLVKMSRENWSEPKAIAIIYDSIERNYMTLEDYGLFNETGERLQQKKEQQQGGKVFNTRFDDLVQFYRSSETSGRKSG
ncbi:hypothetical protein GCM10023331_18110 [Algivirga pacifica]|uniref:Uncharacterized protein n=2 Tax=Algivirga pacifica TaxID=1162670 RepID=A0ABP9DBP1_9BACT